MVGGRLKPQGGRLEEGRLQISKMLQRWRPRSEWNGSWIVHANIKLGLLRLGTAKDIE